MIKRQMCTRCVSDASVRNIAFDEQGVCNYCREYDRTAALFSDKNRLERLFMSRFETPGDFAYDAAVGLSGGKDSTYVLLKLVRDYKLKVKAFTIDNGFLSAAARKKIAQIASDLHVEHEFICFDESFIRRSYRAALKKYLSPCIACSLIGYAVMINYASRVNARVCVNGRSFPQLMRNRLPQNADLAADFVTTGLSEPGCFDLAELYGGAIDNIKKQAGASLAAEIDKLIGDARAKGYREFVSYFLYHDYDLKEIVARLNAEVGWSDCGEHYDCEVHNAAAYLKNLVAGRAHIMPEISVFVREGKLTRDEALQMLADAMIARPDGELNALCKRAGVGKRTLVFKAAAFGKLRRLL